jgi:hypothetical protein
MNSENKQNEIIVQPNPPPAEVIYRPRKLNVFSITEQEIENLAEISASSSTYVGFMSFCFALFLSFLIAVLTTEFDSPEKLAVFVAICVVGLILFAFFGIMWIRSMLRARRVKESIKGRL